MNDLNSRISIIKQKIARIRQEVENSEQSTITLRRKINFHLNTPITIKELVEIENYYEITFPSEYRAFITNIANGGSGPNSGLLSLQDSLMYLNAAKQQKRLDKEFLKIPFT
ncbi:MAG: SMI1/KNR4 family protein, partial [Waterburya sp.]